MQTLRVDWRNSNIFVSDKNQCRNPNPVDLVVYPLAGDDASSGPGHTKPMSATPTASPLTALLSPYRVGDKGTSEHNRHHPIDHQSQSEPAGHEPGCSALCTLF